ncbi:hypothetical protein [Halapricum hydrolyticum]|uniref:Uncharacterized protein n=1 Tax=Halapricum hydrolyticum TaxID=2979991 RepID=A0AAE3IA29_9EURY|nr:hypothetical protein [Halapricum hydrolyticum]MCU4718187.1 hypothetical protein [Halapricum hydrolyticum]MCU4726372.1 hypothetical protein [Halapricum hydrolyticum]
MALPAGRGLERAGGARQLSSLLPSRRRHTVRDKRAAVGQFGIARQEQVMT